MYLFLPHHNLSWPNFFFFPIFPFSFLLDFTGNSMTADSFSEGPHSEIFTQMVLPWYVRVVYTYFY